MRKDSIMNKEYILEKLRELKPYLYEKYGISEIGLFGSYARGDYDENSDIDILVEYSSVRPLWDRVELIDYLESKFNRKVDILNKNYIKKELSQNITSEIYYA